MGPRCGAEMAFEHVSPTMCSAVQVGKGASSPGGVQSHSTTGVSQPQRASL